MEVNTRQIRGFATNTLPPVNGIPRLRFKLLKKKKPAQEKCDATEGMDEDDRKQMATSHSVDDILSDDEDEDDNDYEEGGELEEKNKQRDKEFEEENKQEDREELPVAESDDELQSKSQENDLLSDDDFLVDDEPEEKQDEAFKELRIFQEKVDEERRNKNHKLHLKAPASQPDMPIAKRKVHIEDDVSEYILRGEFCSVLTSPMITFTLLISQSDNNEWNIDRIEAHEPPAIVTIAEIRKSIKRSEYFGKTGSTSGITAAVNAALKSILANFKVNDPITALYMIDSVTDFRMKAVLRNIFAEPHYYESLNLLGSKLAASISVDDYEALRDPDSPNRTEIFERVAFSHRIQEKSMQQLATPSDKMLAIYRASLLYHQLEESERAFGHTALFEKTDDPWDSDTIEILKKKKDFVVVDNTFGGKNYLRTAKVAEMESETAVILKRFDKVMIVCAESDDDHNEENGYVEWLKKQKTEHRDDIILFTTLPRRVGYLSNKAGLSAQVLGYEGETLTDRQISLVKTKKMIVVDRTHVLSLPRFHSLMKTFSSLRLKGKTLVLCGSVNVCPDGPGHPFADLHDYRTIGVERLCLSSDINEKKIGNYYSSIEDALKNPDPQLTHIFVATAALKKTLEFKIASKPIVDMMPLSTLKNNVDVRPCVILVLSGADMNKSHVAKAFQCASIIHKSIHIVGDEMGLLTARLKKGRKRATAFGSVYNMD